MYFLPSCIQMYPFMCWSLSAWADSFHLNLSETSQTTRSWNKSVFQELICVRVVWHAPLKFKWDESDHTVTEKKVCFRSWSLSVRSDSLHLNLSGASQTIRTDTNHIYLNICKNINSADEEKFKNTFDFWFSCFSVVFTPTLRGPPRGSPKNLSAFTWQ